MHRDKSLDFVKFAYIMMMITYHCFYKANYDNSIQLDINRYLSFVSGSFPFMAGYFVSAHYFESLTKSTSWRLSSRGLKLLLIYVTLNLIFMFLINKNINLQVITESNNPLVSILIADPPKVIYDILYSIGVVLIIGAVLSFIHKKIGTYSYIYIPTIIVCILIMLINTNISVLIICGVMGILVGYGAIREQFEKAYEKQAIVIASYLFGLSVSIYSAQVRKELLLYMLCVTTLFFSLKHSYKYINKYIYKSNLVGLFSKYSLFIYLFHVPLLVITSTLFLNAFPAIDPIFLFIILLSLITYASMIAAKILETTKRKNNHLDAIYKMIFN